MYMVTTKSTTHIFAREIMKKNYIPELKESGIFYKIMEAINTVAFHANNNAVEEFNAIIAKHVGGKCINFSLKG